MNELTEWILNELAPNDSKIDTIIAIYPGRFQPMGAHHAKSYEWLAKKFGEKNTFVGTSDKVTLPKSPFNFNEKKKIINSHGIKNVVQVKNPYKAEEILKKYDPTTTAAVFMVGSKDAGRLSGKFFRPWKGKATVGYREGAYLIHAPHISMNVPGFGEMSGTQIRKALGSDTEDKQKLFKGIFGHAKSSIYNLIVPKLEKLSEVIENFVISLNNDILSEGSYGGQLSGSEVDDGPRFFYGNKISYETLSKKMTERLGYEVVDYLLSNTETEDFRNPYPKGPIQSVSFYPSGVAGKTTPTNQQDWKGAKAYNAWKKHITKIAGTLGMKFVNWLSAEDSKKTSRKEPNKVEKTPNIEESLSKEYFSNIFEAISLPVEIGDTVYMGKWKNKRVVVKTVEWNEKGDLLINGKSAMKMRIPNKSNVFGDDPRYTDKEETNEVISKQGNKWVVKSKAGKVLGTHDTETSAKKQLTAIEISKHENINEAKQVGTIYHYTDKKGLDGILKSNSIKTDKESYRGAELNYISFTRNKNFHKKGMKFSVKTEYRIAIDGNKLSNNYKIKPFAYLPGWDYTDNWEYDWLEDEPESVAKDFFNQTGDYDEQEERITTKNPSKISNIKNYIISVDKVSDIKESLNEVGEASSKPYKWKQATSTKEFAVYKFKTDSGLSYRVDTNFFFPSFGSPEVEVNFSIDGPSGGGFDVTNDFKSMFKIMATVVDITKHALKQNPSIKTIIFEASKRGNDPADKGRENFYMAYIKKQIPNAKVKKHGTMIFVTLKESVNESLPTKVTDKIPPTKVVTDTEAEKDFLAHHKTSMGAKYMGSSAEAETYDFDDDVNSTAGVQSDKVDNIKVGYEPVTNEVVRGRYKNLQVPNALLSLENEKIQSDTVQWKMRLKNPKRFPVLKQALSKKHNPQLEHEVKIQYNKNTGELVLTFHEDDEQIVHSSLVHSGFFSITESLLLEGGDFVVCAICKEKKKQISGSHCKKHGLTFKEYKEKFPNSITLPDSTRKKLVENNAMKNPEVAKRNGNNRIGTKRPDVSKRNKSIENRSKVSNSITELYNTGKKERKTWNNKSKELKTKAKLGQITPRHLKPLREQYYTEVDEITTKSYREYFNYIPNANKRSRDFHLDHKISKQYGFLNDIPVEVIGHYCNLEVLPHSLNESKGQKNSLTIQELLRDIKYSYDSVILEGGAAGHMNHPFDDKELKFNDIKKMIDLGLQGKLDVESSVTEKTDGQNLMVTWKDGKLKAARNKSTIKEPMDINAIKSKFAGRGDIEKAFVYAMKDLEKAVGKLSDKQKEKIFKGGRAFMNLEIIYPATENVIVYDSAVIQFHGALEYDENANVLGPVAGSATMLQGMIKQVNADVQKHFKIIKPQVLNIKPHNDYTTKRDYFFSKLKKLQKEFNLKDQDTLGLYHQMWWEAYIRKQAKNFIVPESVVKGLTKRWAFFDKSFRLDKKTITDEKFLDWAKSFDKKSHTEQVKKNMLPFETLIFEVGSEILKNVSNYLSASPDKAVQKIKDEIAVVAKDIEKGGDLTKLKKLKQQLEKINKAGGLKQLVPSEGLVFIYGGKTYKITGLFGPVNQILGTLKFG